MSKLSYEDKINIYQERKNGNAISNISKKYNVRKNVIEYLVRLIDKHGYDVLRISKNRTFTSYEKEQIINRVLLNNESACSVAIDEGLLSQGMLQNWIKKYKENGYNIVERKRGRTTMSKVTKKKENETDKEKIKMAQTFNANKLQILTKIVIPSNIPTFFNTLKVNIGLTLVGVISGEFLVSKGGLGYLIVYGGQVFQLDLVMTSVIILAFLAALMYESIVIIEKLVIKYN